jgi:hypothetical protein
VVDGPFILGISIDKYAIYGFDCDSDTEITWNLKDVEGSKINEPPLHYLISSPFFGDRFLYRLYVFFRA